MKNKKKGYKAMTWLQLENVSPLIIHSDSYSAFVSDTFARSLLLN